MAAPTFVKMYGFVCLRIGYPSLYYNHFLINTAILYNGIYPSISRHTHMLVLRKPGLYCYHLPWSAIWSPGIPQVEDRILRSWNVELAPLVVNVLLRHERYSTCTLNKWENEGICQQLLRSVEDCERISLDDVLGASVDSSGQGALEPPVAQQLRSNQNPNSSEKEQMCPSSSVVGGFSAFFCYCRRFHPQYGSK